ncbi:hypothetical protein FSP39_022260 [Pinctada imbricata]|uniref:TIR domain-containing protein n=1 Tax=Pinctada imbricata TaxID=66713 RepID=A0AA89C2B7_PINIB|nr:hypothetical protein FSP39_022260 [Pinctada imbricata]
MKKVRETTNEQTFLSGDIGIFLLLQYYLIHIFIDRAATSPTRCPTDICSCQDGVVQCRDKALTYIPFLPKDTRILYFTNNTLTTLNNTTFKNLTGLNLLKLSLKLCNVTEIADDAFSSLKAMHAPWTLDLSRNRINFNSTVLSFGLRGLNSSKIKSLDLSSQMILNPHLREDAFNGLSGTKIEKIHLNDGDLVRIDGQIFSHLKYLTYLNVSANYLKETKLDGLDGLQHIDLRRNDIHEIRISPSLKSLKSLFASENYINKVIMDKLPSLRIIDLRENDLNELPSFCNSPNSSRFPKLEELYLDHNHISALGRLYDNGECLPRLDILSLSFNPIGFIRTRQFFRLRSLTTLRMGFLLVTNLNIENYAFSSNTLRKIVLGVFQHSVTKKQIFMFENCTSLRKLEMYGIRLNSLTDGDLQKMFSPVTNLTSLSLQQASLRHIPNIVSDMWKLKQLYLFGNAISQWNQDIFRRLLKLTYINFSSNRITVVNESSFPSNILKQLRHLSLSNNPFACTCDNYWFVKWAEGNKALLRGEYPHKYLCYTPPSLNNEPLSSYNPTYLQCHGLEPYQMAIVLASSFLLVFIIAVILYKRYKWHLRYYIYLMRSKKESQNVLPDQNFRYDAFVAYTSDDRSWVISNLMAVLEGQHNFSLCLHERDFLPGHTILDQISETIKNSRKVILVLSNNFAKSQWCQYEILLAQTRLLEEGGNTLILILLDEIKGKYMTNCLRMLLRTITYLAWTDNSEGKKLFWSKVVYSMKN